MNEQIIYDGFERVWKLFEKTDHEIQELKQFLRDLSQETERQFQETDRKFQETDRKFQESERKFREMSQESERKFREMSQESERKFREMSQESERKFREMSQETDKKINKVSQAIGQLGGRWGEFIESMVKPAVVRLFQQRGLDVHEVHHHLTSKRNGLAAEIDLLVTNDEYCVAIEVKSFLSVDDVKEHRERLEKFKILFPRYGDAKLMGAVAGAVIHEDVAKYAYRQGFFILGQKGENMEILNDKEFKPKLY
jgi:hypothetical protein